MDESCCLLGVTVRGCVAEVGRQKVAGCGMMSAIVCLLADEGVGAELQETALDLLASLCDAGQYHCAET